MPTEYNNTYSEIYCNDCEKRSFAKFHFIYHKCGHCLGYNTKTLSTQIGISENAVIAPEIQISASVQETATLGRPDTLSRLTSSSSILSTNSAYSIDSDVNYEGYWCHQCQVIQYLFRALPT